MTHPLTDEILEQFGMIDDQCVEGERIFFDDDMRAAADWQLEQVKLTGQCLINELHENKYHTQADHAATFLPVLIEAMRPTQGEQLQDEAVNKFMKKHSAALTKLADS